MIKEFYNKVGWEHSLSTDKIFDLEIEFKKKGAKKSHLFEFNTLLYSGWFSEEFSRN